MIPPQVIDQILNLDASDVIGRFIQLKKRGSNWQACCPFHNEKTPSFSINPKTNGYKCFGCGKSGNVIGFVMDYKKLEFPMACEEIAAAHNITIPKEEVSEEDQKKYNHTQALYVVTKMALDFFVDNLYKPENSKALEYVKSRWDEGTVKEFCIGFAPESWDSLKTWAKSQGIKEDILMETGLLSESKGKVFDYFRNRIIFPIFNRTGRVVGFTGRDFSGKEDAPKYFNTRETEIFTKGKMLYGIQLAWKSIKEKGYVHLVEGNPDVIRLHEIGKPNTVGTCGTSLTRDHIEEIKKYCSSVTIIGDGDKAGQNAVIKSGMMIIESGMFCNVVPLPINEQKEDPDTFFRVDNGHDFDDYVKENLRDYIIHAAIIKKDKAKNPDLKSKLIDDLSFLVTKLPASSHQLYIEQLAKIIQPKKAWQDKIKSLISEEPVKEEKDSGIPDTISLSDWEKYGFYEDHNCYYFKTNKGPSRGSNFIMEPLFHISSVLNAKRLFKITNEYGFSQVIELDQRDLVSLSNFRLRVESIGNFLFEGTEMDLNKLKRFLYEKTLSAFMISQMGWQKQGFWAWSNGIYNGKFTGTDQNGIVSHNDENFYLPSSSDIYKGEDGLFVSERKFKYIEGKISFFDYSKKLLDVFGDNAMFGICFFIASLYRDHINKLFGFFPILNLFGPKGAGKTELAISLLQFFGPQSKGPNATNTTRPALADHVAMFSNGFCHIDEYVNSLELEKIEFFKGLWDGTGRTRMNMDKDKKKETTRVDCGIMLSGQQMTTADIALFTRLIFLSFSKVEYSDEEKLQFNNLKEIEKEGLCHITHELLQHRKYFITNFLDNYKLASDELNKELGNIIIEDRIFRNWLVIIAAYRTLKDVISLPWDYKTLLARAAVLVRRQNSETKKSNELAIFWSIFEFLVNDGLIKQEVDFKIDYVDRIKTDILDDTEWEKGKTVLMINHSRIFQQYRVHGKRSSENVLPLKTLEYYLKHSKEYLGKKSAVAFRIEKDGKMVEDTEELGTSERKCLRRITTAMVFDYQLLNISVDSTTTISEGVKAELPF